MSLWAEGDKQNGRRPLYSIGLDPFSMLYCAILVVVMLFSLLAQLCQTLRTLFP